MRDNGISRARRSRPPRLRRQIPCYRRSGEAARLTRRRRSGRRVQERGDDLYGARPGAGPKRVGASAGMKPNRAPEQSLAPNRSSGGGV